MSAIGRRFVRNLAVNTLAVATIGTGLLAATVLRPATLAMRPDPVRTLIGSDTCWTNDGRIHPEPDYAVMRRADGSVHRASVATAFDHLGSTLLFCSDGHKAEPVSTSETGD